MERDLYNALRSQIEYYLPEVKYVRMWNNQFARSNGTGTDGRKQSAFGYPCVFIQFHDSVFRQLSLGIQEFDVEISLYLGFKSFETEDEDILDLKERLYWVAQRFQQGNFARLSRVTEEWDYDHDDVSVLRMQFHTRGMDDNRYVFATNTLDSITGVTNSLTFVNVSGLTSGNSSWSAATDDNGRNEYDGQLPDLGECNEC